MTSRAAPAGLPESFTLDIILDRTSEGEANLFIASSPHLSQLMLASTDGYALGVRMFELAAGHPYVLAHLARLAANPAELAAALDRLAAMVAR